MYPSSTTPARTGDGGLVDGILSGNPVSVGLVGGGALLGLLVGGGKGAVVGGVLGYLALWRVAKGIGTITF